MFMLVRYALGSQRSAPIMPKKGEVIMQAIGGLMELFIIGVAGMAFVYFILEPLVCWTLVLLALAVKAMLGIK